MGRYLLDANAFLDFKEIPETIRTEARQAIEDPANTLYVSLAAIWELSIKAAKGKLPGFARLLAGGEDALRASLQESNFIVLPIELEHVLAASRFPRPHGDPFDRIVIAQAIVEDLILISSDGAFGRYRGLRLLRS